MRSAFRLLCALAFVGLAVGLCPARADDADAVRDKLFKAKKEYDAEVEKFRKAVAEVLDKREEDARKAGNKKLVDQVKIERSAFEDAGGLPSALPPVVLSQIKAAGVKLEQAYAEAVKEFTRLKDDAAAASAEKEQQKVIFENAILYGRRTFVSALKPIDPKAWNNWFEKDTAKYKMGKEPVPHSVFMHPHFKGEASVSYALPPRLIGFRATVGVPKHADPQNDPDSALTFEVLGDGKSLWKSEPVTKLEAFQTCIVKLEKVKTLTLRVHCPEAHGGAHAVWFAPILVE